MSFLKMDFSPKASALGSATVGYSEGPNGMLANPSAMTFSKDLSAATSYGRLYADINTGHLAGQRRFHFGSIGAAVKFVSYGNMDRTDGAGEVIGDFSATDISASAMFSREIVPNLSLGLATFFASSAIDTFTALAMGFDIGAMFKFDRGRGHLGFVVKNLGGQLSGFTESEDTLAQGFSLGASYRLKGLPMFALAQGDYFRDSGFSGGLGFEIVELNPLFLRAGYRFREKVSGDLADDEKFNGISAGFGLVYQGFNIDYSFQHYGILGTVHKFGVAFDAFAK